MEKRCSVEARRQWDRRLKRIKTLDEKLHKILNLMYEMNLEMQDMKTDMKKIRKEQKEFREEVKLLKKKWKFEARMWKNKGEWKIDKELGRLRISIEWLEKEKKEKNIVLSGLPIDMADPIILSEVMSNFVERNLEVNVHIKKASKLGQRHCLLDFGSMQDKEKIMQNKHKLQEVRDERIYINNDLTRKE